MPEIHKWNPKMITEPSYIVIDRQGHDHVMDKSIPKEYPVPEHFTLIKSEENLNNMIKSEEVRNRIK